MFLKPTELVPGRWYIDTTGEECVAVRHREYSSLSDQECDLLVVFPRSGNAIPPHLLGTLQFVERPEKKLELRDPCDGVLARNGDAYTTHRNGQRYATLY